MRRLHALAVLLPLALALGGSASAQQPATQRPAGPAGSLVEVKVASAALRGNLLGDPAEQRVAVYLPPSYAASPARRYPTLYVLHGYTGGIEDWTGKGYLNIGPLMDELIRGGAAREMIVVVPNGRNTYLGSFYANSPVTGGWEDYMARELVAYVDATYRTLARPESRGIAGHSMGGYGALMLSMKHPDVFGAVYAMSPCCLGIEGDMGPDNPAWPKVLRLQSKDQIRVEPKSFEEFWQMVYVALSAALSPNPGKPVPMDFPFAERDGRLVVNEEAYATWRSKMPLYLVEQYRRNLAKLRGIYVDYGEHEEFSHIRLTTRAFSEELSAREIPHTFEIYAGGDHGNKIRERMGTRVLRFFSQVLSDGPGAAGPVRDQGR
jgi:S-formylglutathione hydrolase